MKFRKDTRKKKIAFNMMMEPNLLDADELQIELSIRSLDSKGDDVIERLRVILAEEASGHRQLPTQPHASFKSVTSEVSELQGKLGTINLAEAADSRDANLLAKQYTKLLHLQGRSLRIPASAALNTYVIRVRDAIDTMLNSMKCLTGSESDESGDTSRVDIEAKRQAKALLGVLHRQGSAELAELTATGIGSSSSSVNDGASTSGLARTTTVGNVSVIGPPLVNVSSPSQVQQMHVAHSANPNIGLGHGSVLAQRRTAEGGGTNAHGWSMAKWPLRFGGSTSDMPVDEFLFRAETLGRLANLSNDALTLGLHQILNGSAATWYWVFIRNEPNATWNQVKTALNFAFKSKVSDAAIRRLISDRLQRQGERFMEFCISIQELEVRLTHRMGDAELLDTLRRNMLPNIQDRLLFVPVYSVYELQQRVQQVEELLQRQVEVHQVRRALSKVSEIAALPLAPGDLSAESWYGNASAQYYLPENQSSFQNDLSVAPGAHVNPFGDTTGSAGEQVEMVCAFENSEQRRQFTVCWNCDDLGHTYMDCSATRRIFCYGCGAKNVVRPQCQRCSVLALQGNGMRNVRPAGTTPAEKPTGGQTFQPTILRPRQQ